MSVIFILFLFALFSIPLVRSRFYIFMKYFTILRDIRHFHDTQKLFDKRF